MHELTWDKEYVKGRRGVGKESVGIKKKKNLKKVHAIA